MVRMKETNNKMKWSIDTERKNKRIENVFTEKVKLNKMERKKKKEYIDN